MKLLRVPTFGGILMRMHIFGSGLDRGQGQRLMMSDVSATCRRTQRKRERNKRRRRSITVKRREMVRNALKELEHKKTELAQTRSKLVQTRKRALELSKELCKPPVKKGHSILSSVGFHTHFQTKPTASSGLCSSHKLLYHSNSVLLECPVNKLDRYSLKTSDDGVTCEVGSGVFGKCTKMVLCATEVAVKVTTLKEYSYDSIMYEAKVMFCLPWTPKFATLHWDI